MVDKSRIPNLFVHPAVYRIKVMGSINRDSYDYLQGMTVRVVEQQDHVTFAELIGLLKDQGALIGVLQYLNSNLIPILSVEYIGKEEPSMT